MNVTVRNVITSMRLIRLSTGRSFSRASAWSMRCCAADSALRRWISRRATAIAARSRSWREAPATPSSRSRTRALAATRAASRMPARSARRARSRLLPDLGGRRASSGLGFRAAARGWLGRISPALGFASTSGRHRLVTAAVLALPLLVLRTHRRRAPDCFRAGAARRVPAMDAAVALVNRAVPLRFGPTAAPRPGASRRRAGGAAHDGRRADAADHAGGDRGAGRAPGGSLPGQPRRRLVSHCSPTGPIPDRDTPRATRRCCRRGRGDRAAEPALRPGAGGTGFLLFHRRRTGTRAKESGWAGSASAASSTS